MPFVSDIGTLLAHRDVGGYTLSMSHFFDLTGPSFAALRLPAALALVTLLIGPAAGWWLRLRGRHIAATVSVADAGGKTYPVTTSVTPAGYGDNTLSWTFQKNLGQNLQTDLQLSVTVNGVKVNGQAKSYQYSVYIFVP